VWERIGPVRTATLFLMAALAAAGLDFQGTSGPGKGKHIVLVSGDEEYRSEEALPELARILATHHGFHCTVLFAQDPDGTVNPNRNDNIPGLEALDHADLLILFTRYRNLPDDQMKHIVDYVNAGKPIVAMRTATHAFAPKSSPTYADWNAKNPNGGFGKLVLGETWVNHHGEHAKQSTQGMFAKGQENNPILRGIRDGEIWVPTDVYEVRLPLAEGITPLIYGRVLTGMKQGDPPLPGPKNDPMMPVAWTKTYKGGRVFTTTMGSALDLENEGYRRLLVNASYWALGMEKKISAKSSVAIVGDYQPTPFKFDGFKHGLKPEDFAR
jgi:type 1 glutamine amidotransferase